MTPFPSSHFALVTAGHHFLIDVLPFRQPESQRALEKFVACARRLNTPTPYVDAVILRCLAVLNGHAAQVVPSLVDRYVLDAFAPSDCLTRFAQCVDDFLWYQCIKNGSVQLALHFVRARFAESTCAPRAVADALGLRLSTLDVSFKREIGCTLSEYIRDMRVDRGAFLLATTNMSVKEVWVQVGYNHHSNFDHDFRRRFRKTPRDYRSSVLRPVAQELANGRQARCASAVTVTQPTSPANVLIIDDDEYGAGAIARFLRSEGYSVAISMDGAHGLSEATRLSPDVILLEFRLHSHLNGLDVLRQIRTQPGGESPHVVLFTADWELFDRISEVKSLNGVVASKLCDLHQIKNLISSVSMNPTSSVQFNELPWWRRWIA